MLPVLTELQRAPDMQSTLESLVEEGNYWKVGFYICFNLKFVVNHSQLENCSQSLTTFFWILIFLFYMIIMQAFQVLSEFLQLLDSFSELSVMQEMSRGVEVNIV